MEEGSEYRSKINYISVESIKEINESLCDPIEYRKSGLSLNHIFGCPLDCGYCIRHIYGDFAIRKPKRICSDKDAVQALISNKYFTKHKTPIQLFNRATDPFLPNVKEATFNTLRILSELGLENKILIITRYKVSEEDAEQLNKYLPLRITVLVTYSGIDDKEIEPIKSAIAIKSLKSLSKKNKNYKVVLAWRPIVPGINSSDKHIEDVAKLSHFCDAVAFTGIFFRGEIKTFFEENNIQLPYQEETRRKILPQALEKRILEKYDKYGGKNLFRKTSCAVSYSLGMEDYNGHYGIREICDICPKEQVRLCEQKWEKPKKLEVEKLMYKIDVKVGFEIQEHAIIFDSLSEQNRYYIQHNLQFQAHDSNYLHKKGLHGRSNIGWD